MKTGQSTTSFHQETQNLITTSTTYNLYADLVMDESKTGCYSVSPGGMPGSNGGRGKKGWGLRFLLALNSLLPVSVRPIKSKRAWRRYRWPIRAQVFTFRMYWHSHLRDKVRRKLRLNK